MMNDEGTEDGALSQIRLDESGHVEAGKYAVIHVNDTALLGDTWTWLLGHWLATSGRPRCRNKTSRGRNRATTARNYLESSLTWRKIMPDSRRSLP